MTPAGGGRLRKWGEIEPRNRRALAVGTVALGVLIGFLALKLTGGGGGASGSGPAAPPAGTGATVAPGAPGAPVGTAPPAAASGTTSGTVAATGGKDPFRATFGLTGTTSPPTTTAGGGPSTTTSTTAGPTTTVPTGPQQVELLDVYPSKGTTYASVKVNQSVYAAMTGQSFDTDFRVVDLSVGSGCGDFMFRSTAFHLCKGQQVVEQA